MARGIAPDKDNPYPRAPKGGNNAGVGTGGGKGPGSMVFPDFLPGQLSALASQLSTFGGTPQAWRSDLKDMTAPMRVSLGGGGGSGHRGGGKGDGKGGGKGTGGGDPNAPVADPFIPTRPDHRAARGFFDLGPVQQQPANATRGLFSAAQPPIAQPVPQQAAHPQQMTQLPPEIEAWMRANQMRR